MAERCCSGPGFRHRCEACGRAVCLQHAMIEAVRLRCFPSCTPAARLGVVIRLARAKVVEGLSLADSLRAAGADVEEFLGAEHVVASQLELRGETKGLWAWADEPGRTPEQVVEVLARAIVRAKNNTGEP